MYRCVRSKFGRFLRAYSTAMGATYPRSFAMIAVSAAAVSATSNAMIKGAPRAMPISPTKTPIKGHSTIRGGAPKIIDFFLRRIYATGFGPVLAFNFGSARDGVEAHCQP